jgi:hypothetical protein
LHAEAHHGRPVYVTEILSSWRQISYVPDLSAISIFWACWDLHQNDEMLSDQNDRFSLNPANQRGPGNPDSEFELFSDRFERLFYQYSLDNELLM